MPTNRLPNDDELNAEVAQILPASDRLRLVALDRTHALAAAKMASLQRELRIVQATAPNDPQRLAQAKQRLEFQKEFMSQTVAETQRNEFDAPQRNPNALILHGRVVDAARLGKSGLTVSALGSDSRTRAFTCTDSNGYFRLEVPVTPNSPGGNNASSTVTLLVNNPVPAILYRGTELFSVLPNQIVYREIQLGSDPGKPVPMPPPTAPERVVVPNVLQLPQDTAIQTLKRAGLLAEEKSMPTADSQIGTVVSQSPTAGATVAVGSTVSISIGTPRDTVNVPRVIRLSFANALEELKRNGLSAGVIEPPDPGSEGRVVGQSPNAGTTVSRGSAVDLTVQPASVELPEVEVPNVVRSTPEDARTTLEKQKLKLGQITFKTTSDNQSGRVLDQTPSAGKKVPPGTAIDIVVGSSERVQVPELVGQTLREARAAVRKANLAEGLLRPANATPSSRVVQQSPSAGIEVPTQTPVDLTTEEARLPAVVPNVVRLSLAEARRALDSQKLTVGTVIPANAPESGVVRKQTPLAGTNLEIGSAVDLEVRAAPPAPSPAPRPAANARKAPTKSKKRT